MQEAVRSIRDILNRRQDIDPWEKTRMEHYLALMKEDVEAQVPTFILSQEQRHALKERAKKEGKELVVYSIQPRSLAVQLQEDGPYFSYVDDSPTLRELVMPYIFDVAFFIDKREKWARPLAESNRLPQERQREMIEDEYSQTLNTQGVKAVMAHAYIYTRADIAHQKQAGKVLIPDFFARTPDQTVGSNVAGVGRGAPDGRLLVSDWYRVNGDVRVWALPAVVSANLEI